MDFLPTYEAFAHLLDEVGFLTLSANPLGFPNVSDLTLDEMWHTGLETDPWQWKSRIVDDGRAAYGKLFHGKPSFISREWYPVFLAARRGGRTFDELYEDGVYSRSAERIYRLFEERKVLAVHEIKRLAGKTGYESAMTALQMGMFLTVSGMTRMTTLTGQPHSWPVTEYRKVEDWAWPDALEESRGISPADATDRIRKRILEVLPGANERAVLRFIGASK